LRVIINKVVKWYKENVLGESEEIINELKNGWEGKLVHEIITYMKEHEDDDPEYNPMDPFSYLEYGDDGYKYTQHSSYEEYETNFKLKEDMIEAKLTNKDLEFKWNEMDYITLKTVEGQSFLGIHFINNDTDAVHLTLKDYKTANVLFTHVKKQLNN
jgi:hypothetical protein